MSCLLVSGKGTQSSWASNASHREEKTQSISHQRAADKSMYDGPANEDLLALVVGDPGLAIDVGCGAGANAAVLSGSGWIVDGLTMSTDEAQAAGQVLRRVYICNLERGLPREIQGRYDAVILSHVLEHIAYPESLLRDLKNVITADGRLYIALPNIMHYKPRLELMMGRFDYHEHGVWDYTHLRWYTYRSAQQMLNKNGYKVEVAGASGALPFGRVMNSFLGRRLAAGLSAWCCKRLPGLFGGQLLFVARPSGTDFITSSEGKSRG